MVFYIRWISYSLQVYTSVLLVVFFGQHILKEQWTVSDGEREDLLLHSLVLWLNIFIHPIYMQGLNSNSAVVMTNMIVGQIQTEKKKKFFEVHWVPYTWLSLLFLPVGKTGAAYDQPALPLPLHLRCWFFLAVVLQWQERWIPFLMWQLAFLLLWHLAPLG